MGLFSFGNKTKKTIPLNLVVFLDVGHGNCRGALVEKTKDGKSFVPYAVFGEKKITKTIDKKDVFHGALSSLKMVLEQTASTVRKSSSEKIEYIVEEVTCVLGSPFYLLHTALISYEADEQFIVSDKLVKNLMQKGVIPEELQRVHGESFIGEKPYITHQRIIDLKINGYSTDTPYDKHAKKLTVSVSQTRISSELIAEINRIIKMYSDAPIRIESHALTAIGALREVVGKSPDSTFALVGNEVTEVALIKNHILLEVVSFPFGKNSLIRHIAKKLNVNAEVASSELSLYLKDSVHDKREAEVGTFLEEARAEWFSYMENTLVSLSEESSIPKRIVLVADNDVSKIFANFALTPGFASQALSPVGITVEEITRADISNLCKFAEGISFDTTLALGAIFSNNFPLKK